jgi:hypothetical protein
MTSAIFEIHLDIDLKEGDITEATGDDWYRPGWVEIDREKVLRRLLEGRDINDIIEVLLHGVYKVRVR